MADDAQRIADCRELYVKYDGRRHEQIEREMLALGHTRFRRRIMYTRRERGRVRPGWIDRFGWRREGRRDFTAETQRRREREVKAYTLTATGLRCDACETENPDDFSQRLGVSAVPTSPPKSDFSDFQAWLKSVSPGMTWDWRHQLYIYQHLKRVTDGTCKRLMIFLPPRHGKSELVTVRYTAWRLRQDPSLKVILAGYSQSLSNNFSRKIKNVLCDDADLRRGEWVVERRGKEEKRRGGEASEDPAVKSAARSSSPPRLLSSSSDVSPFPFTKSRLKNTESEWETTMGGGLRAVGVGGGVTGFGAQLIVIDDPVKSRAEAESPKIREKVWNWFNDDLYTRLEPGGSIILIQTRWHEDDLAGRLLREMEDGGEQWEVISLPALAEEHFTAETQRRGEEEEEVMMKETKKPEGVSGRQCIGDESGRNSPDGFPPRLGVSAVKPSADQLGRSPGEALCPERFDKPALENLQRKLGTYSFSALYQQRPTPAEGMIVKREWFKTIVKQPPSGLKWTRGYDLAVSTKTTADYTASFRVAYDDEGNLYIDGGFRKRIEFPEQRRYILGRIAAELDTEHGIELALHGQGIMQDLRRQARLQGRRFRGIQVEGDKLTRALKWSSLAEEGRVRLVRGGWNADFLDEACSFPGGQHDDQIDAVSIAVRMHEKQGGRLIRF